MKNHILETYTKRYAVTPKVQQILANLPDDADQLIFKPIYSDDYDDEMSEPAPVPVRKQLQRTRVRRAVPVLGPLSDTELDDVISVAIDVAINPYLDRDESVSIPERRRDMEIARVPVKEQTKTPSADNTQLDAQLLVERQARADFWGRLEVALESLRDNGNSELLRTMMEDYAKIAVALAVDTDMNVGRWAMLVLACDRVFPR